MMYNHWYSSKVQYEKLWLEGGHQNSRKMYGAAAAAAAAVNAEDEAVPGIASAKRGREHANDDMVTPAKVPKYKAPSELWDEGIWPTSGVVIHTPVPNYKNSSNTGRWSHVPVPTFTFTSNTQSETVTISWSETDPIVGSQGAAFEYTTSDKNHKYMMKVIQETTNTSPEYDMVKTLNDLDRSHPDLGLFDNMVRARGICKYMKRNGSCTAYILMEYIEGGDLFDQTHSKFPTSRQPKENIKIVEDIYQQVKKLALHGLVYLDLKLENTGYENVGEGGDEKRVVLLDIGSLIPFETLPLKRGITFPCLPQLGWKEPDAFDIRNPQHIAECIAYELGVLFAFLIEINRDGVDSHHLVANYEWQKTMHESTTSAEVKMNILHTAMKNVIEGAPDFYETCPNWYDLVSSDRKARRRVIYPDGNWAESLIVKQNGE